jgi:signal transduction histidine kinase
MRTLLRSAANRIAILTALAFALATFAIGLAVYFAAVSALQHELDTVIQQTNVSLLSIYADDGMDGLTESIAARERSASNTLAFAVFGQDGRKLAGALDTPMPTPGLQRIHIRSPEGGTYSARALVTTLSARNRLVVAADLGPVEAIAKTILTVFGFGFVAMLVIATVFAVVLGRYLKRRLDRIAQGSRAFASGDLTGRAEVGRHGDEFDQLAASLNAMLDRIAALLGNLQQVTTDLAHDMRTPLSHLRSHLERLRDSPGGNRGEMIEVAIDKSDELLNLFAAILRISELEHADLKQHFGPLDLSELVRDLAETHEPIAEDSGHQFRTTSDDKPVLIHGDRELLAQALINLIQNALRHTPSSSRIELGAAFEDGHPSLFVRDNGRGIPDEDRHRVLDRFVRLEAARSTPGNGLGLSLVKAISEAHGARLYLRDAEPGLEARIVFAKGPACDFH